MKVKLIEICYCYIIFQFLNIKENLKYSKIVKVIYSYLAFYHI